MGILSRPVLIRITPLIIVIVYIVRIEASRPAEKSRESPGTPWIRRIREGASPIRLTWASFVMLIFCIASFQQSGIFRRASRGGGEIHPMPSKRRVSLKRSFAPKIPKKDLKWPKLPCLRTHIPCPDLRCTPDVIVATIMFLYTHNTLQQKGYLNRHIT